MAKWKLAAYCFTEHGIIPSDFNQISKEDKIIMYASLLDLQEREKKAYDDPNEVKIIGD